MSPFPFLHAQVCAFGARWLAGQSQSRYASNGTYVAAYEFPDAPVRFIEEERIPMSFLRRRIAERRFRHAQKLLWSGDDKVRDHYRNVLIKLATRDFNSLHPQVAQPVLRAA